MFCPLLLRFGKGETMFTRIIDSNSPPPDEARKEGELYRVVTTFGRTFELRYGYYGESDRQNPICEPAVIYPDFTREPLYTDDGEPFATVIQDACPRYKGDDRRGLDTTCGDCDHFRRGEEWFGICTHPKNKRCD